MLSLEVHAKSDTGVIYNVELPYGGLFRLRNIPQNMLQPVLFVDCPTILFPFLRRVLADMTRDGGLPAADARPHRFRQALHAEPCPRSRPGPGQQLERNRFRSNRAVASQALVSTHALVGERGEQRQPQRLIAKTCHEGLMRQPLVRGEARGQAAIGRTRAP